MFGYQADLAEIWWPEVQGATGLSGGEWSASWQDTRSSKVIYLLKRLGGIGAMPRKQLHHMDDEQWRQLLVSPAAAILSCKHAHSSVNLCEGCRSMARTS